MAHAHQQLIESRKKADEQYKIMEAIKKQNDRVSQIANFEIKTTKRIEKNMRKNALDERNREYEVELYDRKNALAELYNTEIEGWRAEVLSKVETMEDRKSRIMERAYALRDAREEARRKQVQSKLNLQWREACDDARTLDSKAMTKFMNEERLKQIQDKVQLNKTISANENNFLIEWNRQLDEVAARDKAKQDSKDRLTKETADAVKAQMIQNYKTREDHFLRTRAEEDDELRRLREHIEEDENYERQKKIDAYERGKLVRSLNEQDQAIKDSEKGIGKMQDKILLDYALRKEAEANAVDEAKKKAQRDSALQYQKFLKELMVKEAEDTAFVDEINRREEEKVWKARDDALQARQDARDQLMRMVDDGRQDQIRAKREAEDMERREGQRFAEQFLLEGREAVQREKEAAAMRRERNLDNNRKLMDQINYRQHKEELERQDVYLQDRQMRFIEAQHTRKLAEQGGAVRLHRGLQKSDLR